MSNQKLITHISIDHFYGIDHFESDISQYTHCVGNNGSGKTHILNALHMTLGGKVLYGKNKIFPSARITLSLQDENHLTQTYQAGHNGKKEYRMINDTVYTRPKYLQNLPIRSVYVSPFDMNMFYFAPQIRRDYLDDLCARSYLNFPKVQKEFEHVMRQRNALLKKIREGEMQESDLDFWDQKIAESAHFYGQYRLKCIQFISDSLVDFPEFFGKYPIQIFYTGDWIYDANPVNFIQNYLKINRQRDIFSGHTHIGPHRDDFGFEILDSHTKEKENVQSFLSRGEMKMLLIGLKIIEAKWIQTRLDVSVIILLDDIFSELDTQNSNLFLNSIKHYQTFLTSQDLHEKTLKNQQITCINL
ncbi:DNA replication/repair protein RecF [Candidatus Gracilibacteria bacterium]|nr:DNA replication/repair protein RecF [Candidatus Gracilibacteria bacterium]